MTINKCSRCGTTGYEYQDVERELCHLCVARDARTAPVVQALESIYNGFVQGELHAPWQGAEFGKALIGNAITGAIRQYRPGWTP